MSNRIIFVGGVFDEHDIFDRARGNIQFASNTLQWALIKGFRRLTSLTILNSVFVGTYPKHHKHLFERTYTWEYENGISVNNVGFINLFLIKNIHRTIAMTFRLIAMTSEEYDAVIVYGMHTPFVLSALVTRIIRKNLHFSIIITDLPNYMSQSKDRGRLFCFLKSIDTKLLYLLVKGFDSFVLLTEQMTGPLGITDKPFVVVEGAVDPERVRTTDYPTLRHDEKKIILYTGNLNERNGINNLVEAFEHIGNMNYELWVCGEGDETAWLVRKTRTNENIKFFGLVSKERVYELQDLATLLVNPRQGSSGEYTKYSFPSKTMEYLLSGKPVVAYKLAGVPDEYDDYINYVEGTSIEDLADKIVDVCSLPYAERHSMGIRGREFVIRNKSGESQAKKILDMITGQKHE